MYNLIHFYMKVNKTYIVNMNRKTCRLCCENDATICIFNNKMNEKIMYCCSNINIKEGDRLPSRICISCEKALSYCYKFIIKCEESDKSLRQSLAALVISQVKDELKPKTEVKTEITDNFEDEQHCDRLETIEIAIEGIKQDQLQIKSEKEHKRKPYRKKTKHNEVDVKCPVCGRECASPSSLVIHMRSHTNEKPYSCLSCDKKYKDSGTLKRHMERNHYDKRQRNFICENCGKGFFSKSCVQIHMRTHTGETPYACSECPARFTQISALLRHKRRHTGAKDYKCPTCSKRFCTKEELKSHLSVHTAEKNYLCPICNIAFKYQNNLRKHIRQHSEPNRFICNYCGRTFNAKGNLKIHIDRQHSAKSGHCNTCSKYVPNIEVHMWRHTGQRPLKCELCTSSFYELKALGRHINFRHKETDKYKCEVEGCSMSFPSRPMLHFHTAKLHSTKIPFPCDRCSRGFYRKNDLARHKIGTHKERLS